MIYFDNSATTRIKPTQTINNIILGVTKFSANPGRSGHDASLSAALAIGSVREQIRSFVGADRAEDILFTLNCTEALNLAILGSVKFGGHVICTENEHNSVLRPLEQLRGLGQISVSVAKVDKDGKITASEIAKHLKRNTYLIVTNHISNVNGDFAEIEEIGRLAKAHNIIFLVDGAQSAGHEKINMEKMNINMLALAGHKGLLGAQGVGVLCTRGDFDLRPIKFGGTGTNSIDLKQPNQKPEGFESGTVATPAILSLGGGIEFVSNNFDMISTKIKELSKYLIMGLEKIDGIKVYTNKNNLYGVISFNLKNYESSQIADYLNLHHICVRSGLHCAPLKHAALKTTQQGTIRVSFSHTNTTDEIDELLKLLKEF
ncbi:MAG: aminotransferase class V-fold PLP-dependent enzyme [Clostridia bacterium]